MMWERPIQHSIRPDKNNPGHFIGGIVLPYHEILELAANDASLDAAEFLACAPDEARAQFSYASEHVSHGTAITSLLACKNAIERAAKHLTGPFEAQIAWIEQQINRVWKLSGPCPGLGSALSALEDGFNGTLFALEISATLSETDDPWLVTEEIFAKRRAAPPGAPKISNMLRKRWEHLHKKDSKRAALLRLLSRFELTRDQAARWFEKKEQTDAVLENPYLPYERDRHELDAIGFWTIDRGVFPDEAVFKRYALPKECTIDPDEYDDPRRLRGACVMVLEAAASKGGHTLRGAEDIHAAARELPATRAIPLDATAIEICEDDFKDEIVVAEVPTLGGLAAQLKRYSDYGSVIRRAVEDRLKGKTATAKIDWRAKLDTAFGPIAKSDNEEEKARKEKALALGVMANTRLSVLIGAAGTGKTTVLRHLLEQKKLVGSGVALLAPTGKARVRLGQQTRLPEQTQTLAQFLMQYRRYDGNTGRYFASAEAPQADGVTTCIVDEASMLTEDQLAALVDALPIAARLILVGDPRQLPPIGAGRPFVDLISYLEREHSRQGVAELTVRRRHASAKATGSGMRDLACADVQLADLFSGRDLPPGEDEILERVLVGKSDERLRVVSWKTPSDLRSVLHSVLAEELNLTGESKDKAMSLALGATEQNGYLYHNAGPQIGRSEAWQILTPHRNLSSGSIDINRHIKTQFRRETLQFARTSNEGPPRWRFRTIAPRGPEQITYGDKVICVRNHRHQSYGIGTGAKDKGYVANGEIGMVVGQAMKSSSRPEFTNVQFASQPEFTYGFSGKYFSEERSPVLELAYAVTVHKAQGSEFGKVLFVLPERSRLLSREMLYTALTRQMDRVIILHQGGLAHLRAYRSPFFSEVARRVTNLFAAPNMIEASPPAGLVAGPVGRAFLVATDRPGTGSIAGCSTRRTTRIAGRRSLRSMIAMV
jgi:ATP-dependent exoDNAse (exonuclease V) alpha subunit